MREFCSKSSEPTFLNHTDDFGILAQRDDLRIFGQFFGAGIIRGIVPHFADWKQRFPLCRAFRRWKSERRLFA